MKTNYNEKLYKLKVKYFKNKWLYKKYRDILISKMFPLFIIEYKPLHFDLSWIQDGKCEWIEY